VAEEEKAAPLAVEEEEDELKEEVVCEEGAPGWVVTFGDMMSLLLTFFILLLSFATRDRVQFQKLSGVLQEGFGVIARTNTPRTPRRDSNIKIDQRVNRNSRTPNVSSDAVTLQKQIDGLSTEDKTKRALEVLSQANKLKVSVPANDIFVPGTDQIRPTIHPLLDLLAVQARSKGPRRELAIEVRARPGSRCDQSFNSRDGCDYWRLTSYQAIKIGRYLKSQKVEKHMIVPVGRGTAKPSFIPDSDTQPQSDSTVEFIYLTQSIDLDPPR
jgi:chemotaxis protein MotB